ncbi:MAG: hypothetical protein PHD88_09700 [Firmicutes bacterium]|nr:hypothetical protein [Bacillota bacterium]MDD4263936.1 hypothetical protein [Bacillota bacterium]MDD4694635.1 hypothetical protein [Bacillota bacterium]
MDDLIHLCIDTKIDQVACMVFPELNQQLIDNYCQEINSVTEYYRNVLNENTIYSSDEWTGERFKQDFLMTSVLAVRQGRQTEIWPNLKKTSGDLIVDCLMDMVESAKTTMSPDEIVSKGLVPKVIGVEAATEILHKYFPGKFVTRNEKLESGLAYFVFNGDKAKVAELNYADYIKQMDLLSDRLDEYIKKHNIHLAESCRFYVLEKLLSRAEEVLSTETSFS